MNRRLKISLGVFICIVVLATAGLFGLRFFSQWREWQNMQALEKAEYELMRPYMEDTVGGKTPEETYELFLEALKKEDINLAAKYFVLDKQEEWRESFEKIKAAGEWGNMIGDIEKARGGLGTNEDNYQYDILNEEGIVGAIIDLVRQENGVWKIRSL